MDPNIRQLLDEIFRREGFQGLNQYASRDAQSKGAVDEYLKDTIGVTTHPLVSPEDDCTARCRKCTCFWYPGTVIQKCPECGNEDQSQIDYYPGQVENFTQVDSNGIVTKSSEAVNIEINHTQQGWFKRMLNNILGE